MTCLVTTENRSSARPKLKKELKNEDNDLAIILGYVGLSFVSSDSKEAPAVLYLIRLRKV